MAPEVLRGEAADVHSDVWLLGVVLFEMAAGRRPFDGSQHGELISSILLTPTPELPPNVPASLQASIRRCLVKGRGERYQQASEVKAALDAAGAAVSGTPRSAPLSRRALWPVNAVAAAALIVAAAVRWRRAPEGEADARRFRAIAVLANLSGDASQDFATAIAREIRATIAPADASFGGNRRIDPAAYDLYLRGRALVFRYNEASIAEAISLFSRALQIEPEFAQAWSGLASAHSERGIWGVSTSREASTRAREAITRALALDPNIAETFATLANINTVYDWDWAAAERAVKRAIELAPGDGRPRQVYGAMLMAPRRFAEAIEQDEVFLRLDPTSTLAASNLARALYRARQFDRSVEVFRQAIALDPSCGPNYARLADV